MHNKEQKEIKQENVSFCSVVTLPAASRNRLSCLVRDRPTNLIRADKEPRAENIVPAQLWSTHFTWSKNYWDTTVSKTTLIEWLIYLPVAPPRTQKSQKPLKWNSNQPIMYELIMIITKGLINLNLFSSYLPGIWNTKTFIPVLHYRLNSYWLKTTDP